MRSIHMISILFMVAIFIPASASAATIEVPADYPTIQQAIDAAVSGDIVMVAPGTYYEHIDFNGKGIEVISTDGALDTVIDGNSVKGSVVMFDDGETYSSRLEGFTITNGKATYGGGIHCDHASPRIENNIIKDNSGHLLGGGIYCSDSAPEIHNNTISGNFIVTSNGRGGGIYCGLRSSPSIDNNVITGNQVLNYYGWGGGIYCGDASSPMITNNTIIENESRVDGGGIHCINDSSPTIRNNLIEKNKASTRGAGIYCYSNCHPVIENNTIASNESHWGAGIYLSTSCAPDISKNIISGNYSTTSHGGGGGIFCINESSPTIWLNEISGNSVSGEYAAGGGIWCKDSSPWITTNRIFGNVASTFGGGISCGFGDPAIDNNLISKNKSLKYGGGISISVSDPTLKNNTLYGNYAAYSGGALYITRLSDASISNCILWNNNALEGPALWVGGEPNEPSHLTIEYSDVEGGYALVHVEPTSTIDWGPNMLDEDPLFVDAANKDFHLTWGSPCINRGNNTVSIGADIDGNARPQAGTVDMGADEFSGLHRLDADMFTVSEMGGTVNFTLTGGPGNAGRLYYLLGSVTGTTPAFPLPGGNSKLRITWDLYTDIMWNLLNTSVYQNFWINLDTTGSSTAQLNVPPLPSGFVGHKMYYAFCLGWPWEFVSNPIEIEIVSESSKNSGRTSRCSN